MLLFGGIAQAQVLIEGNVYGGGNIGEVSGNTTVTVKGGTVGRKLTLQERKIDANVQITRVHAGSVYGGGNGYVDFDPANGAPSFGINAGRVRGNTTVTIGGDAVVRHAVYGGGNIATVGTCTFSDTDHPDIPVYTAETGTATVTIEDRALIGPTKLDLTTATDAELTAAGGISLTQYIDSCFKYLGGNEGWVFGGSRGFAGSELKRYSFVDKAIVTINGDAKVLTVYGGGENGHVKTSTNVTIGGNAIIGIVPLHGPETEETSTTYVIPSGNTYENVTVHLKAADGELVEDKYGVGRTVYRGNVFGGGKGTDFVSWPTSDLYNKYSYTAGRVYGNTTLTIQGNATIYNRVYGGGPLASVGTFTYASAGSHTINGVEEGTGHTYVTIKSGTIGSLYSTAGLTGLNNGDVFGGGRGLPGRAQESGEDFSTLHQVLDLAYVGHTHVTVEGGNVLNSVYGGGANGHVQGDSRVTIKQETSTLTNIGHDLGTWHGNVYGGGGGTGRYKDTDNDLHFSITAGRVYGDAYVTIQGGSIYHNVYGCGSLASVGTYNASDIEHPYLGHGYTYVNVTGGTIGHDGNDNGMVFGSGRGEIAAPGNFLDNLTYAAHTVVNIGSGDVNPVTGVATNLAGTAVIKGSVYGSGENGHVYLSSKVNVFAGTIGIAAADYNPNVEQHFANRGNVYGAGCGTDKYDSDGNGSGDTYNANAGIVQGNTEVNIYGGYISRNVYGGGAMATVGMTDLRSKSRKHDNPASTEFPSLSWPYDVHFVSIKDHNNQPVTTGKATVNIRGGHIGTLAAPMISGNVFGSSRGDVGPLGLLDTLAMTRQTEVNIDFNPFYTDFASVKDSTKKVIIGSVYGSGEDGFVYGNTQVTFDNGIIGGSVFGGGSGTSTYNVALKNPDYDPEDPNSSQYLPASPQRSITAGKVYGNTGVEINGGYITHNVYGGGNLASVGKGNYIGYGEMTGLTSGPANPYGTSGKCTININGGTIGTNGYRDANGYLNGFVYGSSKGTTFVPVTNSPRYDYSRDFFLGYANETEVNIGSASPSVVTTPVVKGTVFGGGENGHVRWNTNVTVNKGSVGVDYVSGDLTAEEWLYRGNVYGAGRGMDKIGTSGHENEYCSSAGSVTLNTTVTVNGGTIYRNVYGGGSMATVGPPPSESGYTPGTSLCNVIVNGGTIGDLNASDELVNGGDVFGGTRGILESNVDLARFCNVSNTLVDINTGADIKGNIYGGGEIGQVKHDAKVDMSDGLAEGSIYGGGKGDTRNVNAALVLGNTEVDMSGGTVERSIYGGGQLGSVGTYIDPDNPTSTDPNIPYYTAAEIVGTAHVVGEPKGYAAGTGKATVKLSGSAHVGHTGSLMPIASHDPDDDDRGWVFCGGCGILADTVAGHTGAITNANLFAIVGDTYLEIDGNAVVTASVYGGSENGLVLDSTYVLIKGGQIGTGYTGDGSTHSWQGAYTEEQWAAAIAAVNAGTIGTSSYTNPFHECHSWANTSPYYVYDIYANKPTHPNNISTNPDYQAAALTGTNGHSFFGNVFGGGSGYYPIAPGVWRKSAGRVWGNTRVEIQGGHILTNVYGGNEVTDVKGAKCTIVMSGGTVGVPRTVDQIKAHPTTCNIYGGGMGDYRAMFDTYNNVNRTVVNITGGTVFGSVFGGSAEGHVLGHSTVTVSEANAGTPTLIGTSGFSGYDGLVFGGGRGNAKKLNRIDEVSGMTIANFAAGRVQGNATVTMSGGHVLGNLYGGGFVARTGVDVNGSFDSYVNNNVYDSENHGMAKVELTGGGTIGNAAHDGLDLLESDGKVGNVYGGGCGDPNEYREDDIGRLASSAVEISGSPTIYGSVFGGGQQANAGYWLGYGPGYAIGTSSTKVTISGAPTIGTALEFSAEYANNTSYTHPKTEYEEYDGKTMLCHTRTGNVYGGGQGDIRLKHTESGALIGTGYPEGVEHGHCGGTEVKITSSASSAVIRGSVYGGCVQGAVWGDTKVTIEGGTIGSEANTDNDVSSPSIDDNYYFGSVYGGSHGLDPYTHLSLPLPSPGGTPSTAADSVFRLAGRVYGDAVVEIKGGQVRGNVFGGGELGSVGTDNMVDGKCTVTVSGGEIGPLDGTGLNAYVFGGGKGFSDDPYEYRKKYANVNSTEVTVSGGTIWGSVLGGGSDAHTLGDTKVVVNTGANIGTNGLSTYDGNIFGGGRNFRNTNHTNGRVGGNVEITMDGGTIQGSIFGGGRLALTGVNEDGRFPTSGWDVDDHGNVTITVSGETEDSGDDITYKTVIGNGSDRGIHLLKDSDESVGDIFGSGKGDTQLYQDSLAGRVTNSTIIIQGSPRIHGAVFGGGEMASIGWWTRSGGFIANTGKSEITIGRAGAEGANDNPVIGTYLELDPDYISGSVTINGQTYTPSEWTIIETVNGVKRLVHTCTGNVFGGCQGDVEFDEPEWPNNWPYMGRSNTAEVTVNRGTIIGNVFGGPEQGTMDGGATVTINGGTIGSVLTDDHDVTYNYGGVSGAGYGSDEDDENHTPIYTGGPTADLVAGRVYGDVQVDVLGGTINGNVFGGASFAYVGGDDNGLGNVTLNIGNSEQYGDPDVGTTILGSVYGANNRSGTPYGNVNVHIHHTAHNTQNAAPATPPGGWTHEAILANNATQQYALKEVFGGGNQSHFTPNPTRALGSTTVHVYKCENTIKDLYGGGNAADIGVLTPTTNHANANVIVEGGRFDRVFGGGNGSLGESYAANIYGLATTTIDGGVINEAFGGGNEHGIVLSTELSFTHGNGGYNNTPPCDDYVDEIFGGSNEAPIIGDVITNLYCGDGTNYEYYGGTNNADIWGNVTLNVYGGHTTNLYGGSKGDDDHAPSIKKYPTRAEIEANPGNYPEGLAEFLAATGLYDQGGTVTVNLYGGTIENVFGGNKASGNIEGLITVNVIDTVSDVCPLDITNIYGASNNASYTPSDPTLVSPIINVVHIDAATGIRGNVFGGAKGASATVTSNPKVNIGYNAATMSSYIPVRYRTHNMPLIPELKVFVNDTVFGGGEYGKVDGSTEVNVYDGTIGTTDGHVGALFGGGKGSLTISGRGIVEKDTHVNIYGGTVYGNVYGGGNAGEVKRNVTVTMTDGTIGWPYLSPGVPNGLYGYLFGGANQADIDGNVTLNLHGGTIRWDVFGGSDAGGNIKGKITLNVLETGSNTIKFTKTGSFYGAGRNAAYAPTNSALLSPELNFIKIQSESMPMGSTVYGGGYGYAATVTANPVVNIGYNATTMATLATTLDPDFDPDHVEVLVNRVHGGGEEAPVNGNTVVNFTHDNTKASNLYGGGMGDRRYPEYAKVTGNCTVYITGGSVGFVDASSNIVGGDAFGGGMDAQVTGNTRVEMSAGTVKKCVFGAGQGDNTVVNQDLGRVHGNSTAVISNTALIEGNVYGGGQLGQVNKDATVTMTGGTVGVMGYTQSVSNGDYDGLYHVEYDDEKNLVGGSVFGGGQGRTTDPESARVKGNTNVSISGGHVYYSVYGGGEIASVGEQTVILENPSDPESDTLELRPVANTGLATVNITGGQVGPEPRRETGYNIPCGINGLDGYVYGGGKGIGNDPISLDPESYHPYGAYHRFANVNNTIVTVNMSMASSDTLTNRLWGSVFGGAEDGHVLGDARVNFVSGYMGTQGKTSYDGNIFGGGRNYAHKNYTAGRVGGNTTVEMTGGQLFGNIYGGGRLALTGAGLRGVIPVTTLGAGYYQAMQEGTDHGYTKVMVKGGTIGNTTKTNANLADPNEMVIETFSEHSMGNVYGGGMGTMDGIDVSGHPKASSLLFGMTKYTEVEISGTRDGTRVYGIVFGGGETANVGKYTWKQAEDLTISDINVTEGKAKVSISGGTIGADRAKMRYEKDPANPQYPKYNDDLGYVYGGGEGAAEDPNDPKYLPKVSTAVGELSLLDLMATVYETEVNISGTAWVKASVFGGAESGHVIGNTKVTISGGQIGAGDNGASDVFYNDPTVFVNPATTTITSSLKGTCHWDFTSPYSPYDPALIGMSNTYKPTDGRSWFGNVFGGGSGWFPYITGAGTTADPFVSHCNSNSGKVWGNTQVIINDGHILNNVYGGNEATDVGGNAIVTMNGGTIGVPRTYDKINELPTFGYLFGGGCGDPRAESLSLNNVGGKTVVTVTGGIIYGSVYGGAEDGHVIGNTEVYVGQGDGKTTIIGCAGTSYDDGNIFGSGRNYLLKNYTGGRVGGNTLVEMTGGLALGSVYGGGRNAMVGLDEDLIIDPDTHEVQALQDGTDHGKTTVRVKGGTVGNLAKMRETGHTIGYVFGGGKGSKVGPADHPAASPLLISMVKNTEVFISQDADDVPTRIYGRVYGGGEVANVGNYGWKPVATAPNISEIQLLSDGEAKVDVSGGVIGLDNMQMKTTSGIPDDFGHVFGGGEGWTQKLSDSPVIDVEGNHLVELMATVGNTDVTIDGSAFVLGSVYGGSSEGHVLTNTLVKIKGGQIGAGNGVVDSEGHNRPYTDDEWDYAQYQSLPECAQWDYVEGGAPYDPNIIEGGKPKPGKNGATFYGNVFGGGSGYYPYGVDTDGNSQWLRSSGQVRGNTRVEVTGGHILTSLYGGCETTDVGTYRYSNVIHGEEHVSDGQSTVIMSGGTLGVPRTLAEILAHPVTCYVFGSGKGDPRFYFNTWTNVWNSKVEIKGTAWVYGSVFGGGEEAHVLNDVDLDVSGNAKIGTLGYSYVDGNIFGGGRGFTGMALTAGTVGRKIDIDIAGGTMLGSVYGGGRLASVGTYLVDKEYEDPLNPGSMIQNSDYYGHFQPGDDHGKITINITGGTIGNDHETATLTHTNSDTYGGNVFGGCMGRFIPRAPGSSETPIWPSLARCRKTIVNISQASSDVPTIIKNSVYGGGEIGTVRENTTVTILGGTIGGDYGTNNYCGHVFGGGKGSEDMTYDNDSTAYLGVNMPTAYLAGRVYGNTTVTISGGQIYENVFGGGKVASVGWVKGDGTLKNGKCTVTMEGGIIGPLDYSGVNAYIFGGPKGGSNASMKPYCNVNSTEVEVNYTDGVTNHLWGSIFGGGSEGHVLGDAKVTLESGTVGTAGATSYDGNIFGGGRNYHEISTSAGRVGGDITVDMQGGKLMGNIYGGGRQGLTGVDENGDPVSGKGNITVTVRGGTVGSTTASPYIGHVFGGGKGNTKKDTGSDDFYKRFGETRSTSVTISGTTTTTKVYGSVYGGSENGRVLENATVTINGGLIGPEGSTNPQQGNVMGGGRGIDPYSTGGGGDNPNAGRVFGQTRVHINGGHVTKNVFGGGEKGIVEQERIVNINGGQVDMDVSGGSYVTMSPLDPEHGKLKTVNVRGGHILGNVFGGSHRADEGVAPAEWLPANHNSYWSSFVNITGGEIDQNVYGAGYGGTVKGSVCVNIGLTAVKNAPTYVNSDDNPLVPANTFYNDGLTGDPTPAKLVIGGNVYGGSYQYQSGGTTPEWDHHYDISGFSTIFIDGGNLDGTPLYNTTSDDPDATNYMNIAGGIYGSGNYCESGERGREIIIRNYGTRFTVDGDGDDKDNMTDATRKLTTLQRGGTVLLDNSNIRFEGDSDISGQWPDRNEFGVLQVDKGLFVANGSGIVLGCKAVGETPATPAYIDSIYLVKSLYLKDGEEVGTSYDQMGAEHNTNWEVVGIQGDTPATAKLYRLHVGEGGTVTPDANALTAAQENVIIFNSLSNLRVRYRDTDKKVKYGELQGFFRVSVDHTIYPVEGNESFAYARPKLTSIVNPLPASEYPTPPYNASDGGFLSYTATDNDFTKLNQVVLGHKYLEEGNDGGTLYTNTKQYPYYNVSTVAKDNEKLDTKDYRLWALPSSLAHKWYVDGRGVGTGGWGKDESHEYGWGDYPDKPKKTITGTLGIYKDPMNNSQGYKFDPANDIIFVVGPVEALIELENLNLSMLDETPANRHPLKLYRYPGGHKMSNNLDDAGGGEAPSETPEDPYTGLGTGVTAGPGVNYGAMIHANKTATALIMDNVMVDGLFEYDGAEPLQIPTSYSAEQYNVSEPLVVTENNSKLTLKGGTILLGGYNKTDAATTWYPNPDYVASVHQGGALFVHENATVNVEGLVTIKDNKQKNGEGLPIKSNVYLPTFDKSLNITAPLDDGTEIGVTSPMRKQYATQAEYKESTYLNNTFSPVAVGVREGTTAGVSNAVSDAQDAWTHNYFRDDQSWFFGNGNHDAYYSPVVNGPQAYTLYFGWTWANVVRKNPDAPATFNYADIDSEQDLAWLLSKSYGMNGEAPTTFSGVTIEQTADLDMKQYVWVPIGTASDQHRFVGTFDGKGHIIKNLNIAYIGKGDHRFNLMDYGLFGYVYGAGEVKRAFVMSGKVEPNISVSLSSSDVFAVGGLVGCLDGGTLCNSEAAFDVYAIKNAAPGIVTGGLVGLLKTGEAHSSMSMAKMSVYEDNTGPVGGLVGKATGGRVVNSFVNADFVLDGTDPHTGGLLGTNDGATVNNCYVNWTDFENNEEASRFKGIVSSFDNGSFGNCYAREDTKISDSDLGVAGNRFTSTMDADRFGYMYYDNVVTIGQTKTPLFKKLNEWVGSSTTYARWARPALAEINGDLPVLLLCEFDGTDAYQGTFRSVGSYDHSRTKVQYGGPDRDGNEVVGALTRPAEAADKDEPYTDCLLIYGDVTNGISLGSLSITQDKVSIHEDASILDAGDLKNYANTYVGISFDNSCGHATSTPGVNSGMWGNGFYLLPRDWHMFSTPLSDAPQGFDYRDPNGINNNTPFDYDNCEGEDDYDEAYFYHNPWLQDNNEFSWLNGGRYWMKTFSESNQQTDGYFPTNPGSLFTSNELYITESDDYRYPYGMDFYAWNEPEYHWINFKRNGHDHWHSDENSIGWHDHLDYKHERSTNHQPTSDTINANETTLISGKGYMAAINKETFMQSHGYLNDGDQFINLTKTSSSKLPGWNLVGNPYHGYLDFNEVAKAGSANLNALDVYDFDGEGEADPVPFYVVYNADKYETGKAETAYRYYPKGGSGGGDYANRFLHPHQGFYVKAKDNRPLTFTESMLTTRDVVDANGGGGFRDERPAYPLVNLYLSSDKGCADVTVIELERPEWGGALKLKELRVGDGLFYAQHDNTHFAALFAEQGVDRIPVWFEAKDDDIFTMKWNTANGEFQSMYLIDNITGIQYDMLRNDTYTFEGHKSDYPSRFLIVFNLTGVEENEDKPEVFVFHNGAEWVVTGDGLLQFIDVNGQVLWQDQVSGQSRVSLPWVADGPYLFRLTNSAETKVQKVIVTKY